MNVLLIDDHSLFREGLALLLAPLVQSLDAWHADSCEEALELLGSKGPADLVLIDLALPGISGQEGIRLLRDLYPQTPVVALSSTDDKEVVLDALDAGAMGFIPKSSTATTLLGALRLVLSNGVYLPPSVFLGSEARGLVPRRPAETVYPTSPTALGLTPRQADVLFQILQGKSAKLIARDLLLAPNTVKTHTSAVLRALKVTTRTQAVVAAGRLGLRFDRPLPN